MLDISRLETWLWDAACQIRGPLDAPKFKDYILPLVSLKRLSDVFGDELDRLAEEFGDREMAATLVAEDHALVRFYVPPAARWVELARRTTGLGEYLTDAARAVARENPRLQGVIDTIDFNATAAGQRIVDDAHLAALIGVLSVTVWVCVTSSRISWVGRTSICGESSPKATANRPVNSILRRRLAG